MGLRFNLRLKILPGVSINLGKRGISTSIGPRGAKVTIGSKGVRSTVGIPGTGVSYTKYRSYRGWKGWRQENHLHYRNCLVTEKRLRQHRGI